MPIGGCFLVNWTKSFLNLGMLGGIFNLFYILLANNDDHYQTSYLDLQCLRTRHKKDTVKLVLNVTQK